LKYRFTKATIVIGGGESGGGESEGCARLGGRWDNSCGIVVIKVEFWLKS
jgi:hypothetical protein